MDKYGFTLPPTISPATSMGDKYGFTLNQPSVQVKPSIFSGTKESISHLVADPLSLKEKIGDALPEAWNTIKDSVIQEVENIKDVFRAKTTAEFAGAQLRTLAGGAGVMFSPLTAFFKAAENIPILGTASKIVGIGFGAAGEGGAAVGGGIVDSLPISQEAKDAIKPGVQEITALAAQLALGKVLPKGKVDKLQEKYGQEDTQTILTEARKLAAEKPQEVIPPKVEENKSTTMGEKFGDIKRELQPELKIGGEVQPRVPQGIIEPIKTPEIKPIEPVRTPENIISEAFASKEKELISRGVIEPLPVSPSANIPTLIKIRDLIKVGYKKEGLKIMGEEKLNKLYDTEIVSAVKEKVKREKPVIEEKIKLTDDFDMSKPDSIEYKKAEHESNVLAGLEISEAGWRKVVNGEQLSGHSTMPGFIPEGLRSNALVKTVLDHIKNGTLPTKADEVRLYNEIGRELSSWDKDLPKIDKELNVDEIDFTSAADKAELIKERDKIIKQYDKADETIPAQQIAPDKPIIKEVQNQADGIGQPKVGEVKPLAQEVIPFDKLPDYAKGAIQSELRVKVTNEGASPDLLRNLSNTKYIETEKSIDELVKSNPFITSNSFTERPIMSKGSIVIDEKGNVIDGNNRLRQAYKKGEKTIKVFEPFNQSKAVQVEPSGEMLNKIKPQGQGALGLIDAGYKDTNLLKQIEKPKLEGTGDLKTSGLAETLRLDTIAKGVEADFGELPQYRVRPVKTKEALEFVRNNPELADKIISGEINPPPGLLTGEIYSAMKIEAISKGDVDTLIKLSKSKANDIATMLGREVKAFDSNLEVDPVRAIKELNKINEGKTVKSKPETLNKVKEIINKSSSKLGDIIKSLECK
jgi:hypothetical protein